MILFATFELITVAPGEMFYTKSSEYTLLQFVGSSSFKASSNSHPGVDSISFSITFRIPIYNCRLWSTICYCAVVTASELQNLQ